MAMLTTPTRSEMTPDSAPKISGVDRATVETRVEVRVTEPVADPEPAYTRNPNTVDTPTTTIAPTRAHDGEEARRSVETIVHAVITIVTRASPHTTGAPATTTSGIEYDCDLSLRSTRTSPRVAAARITRRIQAAV